MIYVMFFLSLKVNHECMGIYEQCSALQLTAMKSLTDAELKEVIECQTILFYKKGDVIFREHELLKGVYCVQEGICKLTKLNSSGKDHTIKLMGKGKLIGQRSIIRNERTHLSAVALNDVELCFVPREQILEHLKSNQQFSFDLMQSLAQELREAENDLINMAQKTVRQRLAEALIYVRKTFGVNKDGYLNVNLSREDYASIVGTATESAIRVLSQFKKEGLISLDGKMIKIEKLTDLAQVE